MGKLVRNPKEEPAACETMVGPTAFPGVRVVFPEVHRGCAGGFAGGFAGEEAEPDHGENAEGGRAFQAKNLNCPGFSLRQSARSARLRIDRLRQTARGLEADTDPSRPVKLQAICDMHETHVANGFSDRAMGKSHRCFRTF